MKHLLNLNLLGSDINRCFAYLQCFKRDYREITCNFLIIKLDMNSSSQNKEVAKISFLYMLAIMSE